jgi:uncharacterized protein YdeI (YjbR/CyaY-like superfamily)
MTYSQALEEALCYGWIDGVRRSLDAMSFSVRFSPRRPRSIWSRVNIQKVASLAAAGRMAPPGLQAFAARDPSRSGLYSFERNAMHLSPAFARRLRQRRRAWRFFEAQPTGYRKTAVYWVMSPQRDSTRERRLGILIACSAAAVRIPPLARKPTA